MNIFVQLKRQDNFSESERRIAEYICAHPDAILSMNVNELKEKTYVSGATVYRLCDKLQIGGFSELKIRLSADLDEHLRQREFDFDFPVSRDHSYYEIMNALRENYSRTVESTIDHMKTNQIRLAVSAMKRAKQIDFYTSAGNIWFAKNFAFQMQEIGVTVNVPIDEYEQRVCAAASDMSHMAIQLTFEGRGLIAKAVSDMLHRNETPVLLICSPNQTSIKGNYTLYISPKENHYKKISSFSTRLSVLYILDVLYTCYFESSYDENLDRKMKYYHKMREASAAIH
ncbi:MAG: MurR/RpiR family transcriptional regulator [Lachnospiraceae bacterium]|nr:MurR/RpiR family transcriptional regulator [Lachnospiraceae bacterium]